jgi:Tol biopolymer transport system component
LPRQEFQLAILPSEGGSPVHLVDVPQSLEDLQLAWTADGSSILFQQTKDGVSNVWSQPMAGGAPRQITFFKDLHIYDFDVSIDGKTLAVCRAKSASDVVLIEGFH